MKKLATQTKFPFAMDYKKEFGGSLLEGVRKCRRPLSTKHPLHLIIQIQHRNDYVKFIRAITSILAQRIREFFPELEDVFTLRPFTQVISWGRDFSNALKYTVLNKMESFGFVRRGKAYKKSLRRKSPSQG